MNLEVKLSIFGQKGQTVTKYSRSYSAKQLVRFWTKMTILERRDIREES